MSLHITISSSSDEESSSEEGYHTIVNRSIKDYEKWIELDERIHGVTHYRRGLALCHGHNHSIAKFRDFPDINYWYLVDDYDKVAPDYVCDMTDIDGMSYLPDDYFDTVVWMACTMPNREGFDRFLTILHRITRKNGMAYLTENYNLFYLLLGKEELARLHAEIKNLLGQKNIDRYKDTWEEEEEKEDIYSHIIVGNYAREGLPRGAEVNAMIAKRGRRIMNAIFNSHHFVVVEEEQNGYTSIRPVTPPPSIQGKTKRSDEQRAGEKKIKLQCTTCKKETLNVNILLALPFCNLACYTNHLTRLT